jgi:DNA (cytosine-5)-methyltransferase 1
MSNEVIYDLYSCAGGAAVGYKRAGFRTVIGVDNRPSPRYPFEFHQADALEVLRALARGRRPWPGAPWPTAIHSSPPCQFKALATLSQRLAGAEYPDLIGPTRDLLEQVGVPWIIENVPGASLRPDIRLCGCQFGLTLPGVGYLKRERWFETSWHGFYLEMPHVHRGRAISIAGHGTPSWMREKTGHIGVAEWRQVMGVDWTTRAELTEALPPAFTKYVGGLLLERVAFKEAA